MKNFVMERSETINSFILNHSIHKRSASKKDTDAE